MPVSLSACGGKAPAIIVLFRVGWSTTASFRQFVGVEELLHFSETDVKHLGVIKSAHRARIVSSLVALREKAVPLRGGGSSTAGGFVCESVDCSVSHKIVIIKY